MNNIVIMATAVLCFVLSLLLSPTATYALQDSGVGSIREDKVVNASSSSSSSSTGPLYNIRLDDVKLFKFFKDPYDRRLHGRLHVEVKDITTSSIKVKWTLPEMMFKDSVLESNVICETSSGFMLSKKHVSPTASYRLDNLQANTSYIVCVYMLEKSKSSNTTVLHYSCHRSRTDPYVHIPSLRADSIIAVIITLGYICVMIIIGYATWRWKSKKQAEDEAKQKLAIEDEDEDGGDEEDGVVNGGIGVVSHGGSYCDDKNSRRERSSMRGSNNYMNSNDRLTGGGGGGGGGGGVGGSVSNDNIMSAVTFSESEVVLEKDHHQKPNSSAEEVNGGGGCLDFSNKRHSRGSGVKLVDLADGNSQEKKRPKSQSLEDSPVKVTEITF